LVLELLRGSELETRSSSGEKGKKEKKTSGLRSRLMQGQHEAIS
jgi:hypothetical protein